MTVAKRNGDPEWPEDDEPIVPLGGEPGQGRAGGEKLTGVDLNKRNMQVVTARLGRGLAWEQIADTFQITTRYAQRIVKAYRDSQPKPQSINPAELIEERLYNFQGIAEELALIAQTTRSDGHRIRALGEKMQALSKHTELMQATGYLPLELGNLRVEMDMRETAARVKAALDEMDVSPEQRQALLHALLGRVDAPEQD